MRPRSLIALLLVIAAVIGCGSRSPDEVVTSFYEKWRGKDYKAACALLSQDAQAKMWTRLAVAKQLSAGEALPILEGDPKEKCPEAIGNVSVMAPLLNNSLDELGDVDESGDRATVNTPDGRWVLEEVDGDWLISEPLPGEFDRPPSRIDG